MRDIRFQDSRFLERVIGVSRKRPDPPRELSFVDGVISWKPPKDDSDVTHYNIYANHEFNLVRQVPREQNKLQDNLSASRVFIASWNDAIWLESPKILLDEEIQASADGEFIIAYA